MISTNLPTSSISIIIPARNEAENLVRLGKKLNRTGILEIILCDGNSTDNTAEVARDLGMRVVTCPPGRGMQQNRGAEIAQGEILFFLHCDTIPPPDFSAHIRSELATPGVAVGAFRLALDSSGTTYRFIEWGVRLRNSLFGAVYGDQGIFLHQKTFHQVGGFPDQPLLEDYELIRRLRPQGSIALAPVTVHTSARRWQKLGPVRTTIINQLMIIGYHLGVSPTKLAKWYYQHP
ncbi:MAG: TIGR04283 family arsenosugar biosynthesis glycosyltransferase [Desulfobulbaceae bacterium]|nr:TIGR04283 family arsenosugar biosynthesis glycosyltransferase [Desulfobulbaceae bacterium]